MYLFPCICSSSVRYIPIKALIFTLLCIELGIMIMWSNTIIIPGGRNTTKAINLTIMGCIT